jgi:hypothetical protein
MEIGVLYFVQSPRSHAPTWEHTRGAPHPFSLKGKGHCRSKRVSSKQIVFTFLTALPQTRTLYIQEKVHPKVLIDDLVWETREMEKTGRLQLME